MTDPGAIAIEFRSVEYRLPAGRLLLDGFSLVVRGGETLILLGRSGSGKTTCLKMINRLLEPTSGQILIEGTSTRDWDAVRLRRSIGYAIQDVGLFPHYTVRENVGLIPRLEKWDKQRADARVTELLHLVGMPTGEFSRRFPHELSGGQRQRVGLARALAGDPPILLMDEPFGALDPITRSELQAEFRNLQRKLRKTVVFVTHDVGEALRLADRIALVDSGKLCGVYSREEFMRSDDKVVKSYMQIFREGGVISNY